ncbi:uncharacterized protein LOC124920251 [Impatiens glandulifera]|uniref:uncharacterized protein LOC124920251 n=1 Tax=Impatiens glandulifera TaxID=253017 RepID=UPI001FB06C2E|nr:uncharacterized protein LOC124920251 [Impatiens glandulifera]
MLNELIIHWYDFVCFGIVGVSFIGALYVIWNREGVGRIEDQTSYESLLPVNGPDGYISAAGLMPRGHISSNQLWGSCWRGLHPAGLLLIRFASFLIMSGILTCDILTYDASVFIYYTEWTFALVIVYFAIATIVSAHGCMIYYSKKNSTENGHTIEESNINAGALTFRAKELRATIKLQSHYNEEANQYRAGFGGYLMQIAYQICGGAVIMTDIVFWMVIVPFLKISHLQPNLLMGLMHSVNAVFLLIETCVNSLPFPWFRLSYFVLWSCIYVIFQWVVHACGLTVWPYPFLELSTPWAPLWYLCLAVVHIPCFGLFWLLEKGKNSFCGKLFPNAFVRSF